MTVQVPDRWRALFEGRNVAFVEVARLSTAPPDLPPAVARWIVPLTWGVVALMISVLFGSGSGRWWLGLVVFVPLVSLGVLVGLAASGARAGSRREERETSARATQDPIGRLLPPYGTDPAELERPSLYAGLIARPDRPALVVDVDALAMLDPALCARPLAPRGRLPEPEVVDIHAVHAELVAGGGLRPISWSVRAGFAIRKERSGPWTTRSS